jgi:HlyD family secretion protein
MFKKKKIIIIILILLFVVGTVFAFSKRSKSVQVQEVKLTNAVVEKTISAPGEITSNREAELSFPITGKIAAIYVQEGDEVQKGALLASLDTSVLANTAQSYKDARDIAIRNKELFVEQYHDDKDAAGGEKEYNIKLRTYEEQLSQAQASYSAYTGSLKNAYLYAPMNGTIVDIAQKTGETATAGATQIKIADLSDYAFEIELEQEDFGQLTENQEVNVTLDAYPDHVFTGKITQIPWQTEANSSGSQVLKMKVVLMSNGKPLILGMTGDSDIIVAKTPGEVPALNYDEVLEDADGKSYVWVDENGVAKKEYIDVGLAGDLFTEIKTPVSGKIIMPVSPKVVLNEGSKITVVK